MACFIQSYGDVRLALRDRPAFNDFILFPVNDINLVLGFVIDEYFRARFFQSHGFKRVSVDLDIGHLLAGCGVNNADHRIRLVDIATAIVDVQVFCGRIVSDGISVLQQFHARKQLVGLTVEDLEIPGLTIRHVYAVDVFTIEHGVRLLDSAYGVDELACLEVENEDGFVTLWSRKKPPTLEIDFKMIEMPLDSSR